MVWKSQLNNSTTLNSHTDSSRCSPMVPHRLSAKRCALRCSRTTLLGLLNVLEVTEQNTRTSWSMYSCLQNATNINNYNAQISELLGVLATSPGLFQCISSLELYSPGVIIIMLYPIVPFDELSSSCTRWFRYCNSMYFPVGIKIQMIMYKPDGIEPIWCSDLLQQMYQFHYCSDRYNMHHISLFDNPDEPFNTISPTIRIFVLV